MTKLELTAAILERLHDPDDSVPDEDIATLDFLTLDQAEEYLADLRRDENAADLEPDERLPQEVTPELYMEVWNCDIRRARHAVQEAEPVKPAEHDNDVTLTFLMIKDGIAFNVTCKPEEVVPTIWVNLIAPGVVLTNVKQKGVTAEPADRLEECMEIVLSTTNPCEKLAMEDAARILCELKADGWDIPLMLTPSLFLELYNDLEPEEEE